MTIYFTNAEIQIYRHRQKGNTARYAMSATLTVYTADIQPATRDRTEMIDGKFGAVFDAFVNASVDIKEGDQIVNTSTGKRYSVRGVNDWSNASLVDHKELLIVSQDA
jgi:hypothetical protein